MRDLPTKRFVLVPLFPRLKKRKLPPRIRGRRLLVRQEGEAQWEELLEYAEDCIRDLSDHYDVSPLKVKVVLLIGSPLSYRQGEIAIDPVYLEMLDLRPDWILDLKWSLYHEFKHYLQNLKYGSEKYKELYSTVKGNLKLEREAKSFADSHVSWSEDKLWDINDRWRMASRLFLKKKDVHEAASEVVWRKFS